MNTTILAQKLISLPTSDRAYLAEKLLASLDDSDVQSEIESAWCEEALSRYERLQQGQTSSRTAELVMREARRALE